jgi:hypothetical protein
MPITVTYGAFSAGNASQVGLTSYFATYNSGFNPSGHGSGTQGFSTVINNGSILYDGEYYGASSADKQYVAKSTTSDLAFIAQATTSGGTFNQLVYSAYSDPEHTIFGDLDVLQLGSNISPTPSVTPAANTEYSLGTVQVTFSNLTSVLNEGISGGHVIPYGDGTNDVHNILYPLIGGGGGAETSGLETYLNSAGINYVGAANDEVFDGFNGSDLFRVGGGDDTIQYFSAANDTVNLGGLYGYATAAAAYAALSSGPNATLVSVDTLHSITFTGVLKTSLSAADFVLV